MTATEFINFIMDFYKLGKTDAVCKAENLTKFTVTTWWQMLRRESKNGTIKEPYFIFFGLLADKIKRESKNLD